MDDVLNTLARLAIQQQEVGIHTRADGVRILVYPLETGAVVGVSVESTLFTIDRIRTMLRKRGRNLRRYGRWFPCTVANGECFVVTKCDLSRNILMLEPDDLKIAEELLL